MSQKLEAQIAAAVAQGVTVALAQVLAMNPQAAPKAPKAPARSAQPKPRRPRSSKAQVAKAEAQATFLNTVHAIGHAKRTLGKVVVFLPSQLQQLRAEVGLKLAPNVDRFTLSVGNKGWAFAKVDGKTGMTEVAVTPEQAAQVRALFPATLKQDAEA